MDKNNIIQQVEKEKHALRYERAECETQSFKCDNGISKIRLLYQLSI